MSTQESEPLPPESHISVRLTFGVTVHHIPWLSWSEPITTFKNTLEGGIRKRDTYMLYVGRATGHQYSVNMTVFYCNDWDNDCSTYVKHLCSTFHVPSGKIEIKIIEFRVVHNFTFTVHDKSVNILTHAAIWQTHTSDQRTMINATVS